MSVEITIPTMQLGISIPQWLAADANAGPACPAIDGEMQSFANDLSQLELISNLQSLPSSTLDYFALQFNVQFYDQSMTQAQKAGLIEQNFYFQSQLGTPAIIQDLITNIISNAQVLEWFQYQGRPGHFQVSTGSLTTPQYALARKLVYTLKNGRSWFDGFVILTLTPPANVYVACAGFMTKNWPVAPIAT